ncbi:hypothetical protein QCA50_000859 [Cerrena zonata]|uniref:TRP C-terminal domain-containing protein n=1 Tax=Cerrena zonata TaxID=2478898 RepID=A0AAW0GUE2_9APHY
MAGSNGCKLANMALSHMFLFALFLWFSCTIAQPATLAFDDCFTGNTSQKLNVSTLYAQFQKNGPQGTVLNFTLLGNSPVVIEQSSGGSTPVASTLFTISNMLTFPVGDFNTFFCNSLRPASPLPALSDGQQNYCPLEPGQFALSTSVSPGSNFELATYYTRIRALDPGSNELLCVDVTTTPLDPGPLDSPYGHARIIFWGTVGLAIGYWLVVGLARLVSAWGRGSTRSGPGAWARIESAGFILASAISGERLATSPALMRFCTPSLRDIIFHTQWCAALSMVAVEWPQFAYPLLSQTAWSTLSYNISLVQEQPFHWNPLSTQPYDPPSEFADQLSDSGSPLFLDSSAPNLIFQLPSDAKQGISSFAYSVGIRPKDLFGTCMVLFLAILAGTIALSLLVWLIDWIFSRAVGRSYQSNVGVAGTRSPRYSTGSKDMLDSIGQIRDTEENRSLNGHALFQPTARFGGRRWWRLHSNFVSLHGSVLQGNLVRILILFHLPITIFSCYQFTVGRPEATLTSIILAALSFAIFSVLIPISLVVRLTLTNTTKLYDETWTLLFLGPLYNHYRHGSQLFACLLFATNLAFGITIGCGQKSGTAQAIVILVVEVMSALGTSVWLPWGQGASMGLISFLFCVARIVIAVLLVILTPIVSVATGAAQWVAYAILFILALVYLAFLLMLLVKLVEASVRIFGGVGFHRSKHVVDSGLLGALSQMGCCGGRRSPPPKRSRHQPGDAGSPALPLSRPTPAYKDVTPTPSGPPSVLRPEHALQPYKEESDDETGYIMGAWQSFPRPGYSQVNETPSTPDIPKSGFARVGGGRAHYESPYAIASGSTQTFPSVEYKQSIRPPASTRSTQRDYSPPPTPSVTGAAKRAEVRDLPPGAMPPSHIRTKSQTAIIEDASALPFVLGSRPLSQTQNASALDDGDEESSPAPKKKHWFNLRKGRRPSEIEATLEVPPAEPEPNSGRSFVVVRKQRPGGGASPSSAGPSSSSEPEAPRSFAVIRGNQT